MRRSRAAQQSVSVSLFPFLAVLICTMGALIVLLVVISRQASLQAAQASDKPSENSPDIAEIRGEIELIQYDIGLLEQQSRALTEQQLHLQRSRLAVTEQLIRDLHDQYEQLKRDAERAAGFIDDGANDQRELQQRLDRLRQQLAEAARQLDEARREADNTPRTYSILPYRGRNGTRRRPIYIECRRDRVILQPEGVVLKQSDFEEPLGPGNPLAAALRATREYWSDGGRVNQQGQRAPYPLLLVRPDGAVPYSVVRRAIKSWGPDFGYELIEQDWKLELPKPDPALAAVQRRAIADAHVDQENLRRAAPARFRDRDRTPFKLERADEIFGELLGSQRAGSAPGGRGTGNSAAPGNRGAGLGPNRDRTTGDRYRSEDGKTYGQGPGRGESEGQGEGEGQGQSDRFGHDSDRQDSGDGPGGSADEFSPNAGRGGATRGSITPTRNTAGGNAAGESPTPPDGRSGGGGLPRPLADVRGTDWALAATARRNTPVTRPIHVLCERDRISLLPTDRRGTAKVIPLRGATARDIDRVVEAIQQRVETWGIAGEKFYWQPALKLVVRRGGEARASDLRILLRDSGVEVE